MLGLDEFEVSNKLNKVIQSNILYLSLVSTKPISTFNGLTDISAIYKLRPLLLAYFFPLSENKP